jgi:four helix bundle protein
VNSEREKGQGTRDKGQGIRVNQTVQALHSSDSTGDGNSAYSVVEMAILLALLNGPFVAHSTVMTRKPYDIRERTFLFAQEVVAFCRDVSERGDIMRRLAGQLVDAATSVGANVEEADDGQSKPDCISKNCIALKECREARYWSRLIAASETRVQRRAAPLIQESQELVAILRTIVVRAKSNPARRDSTSR